MLLETDRPPLLPVSLPMARDSGDGTEAFLREIALQHLRRIDEQQQALVRKVDIEFRTMREERRADIQASEHRTGARIKTLEDKVSPLVQDAAAWKVTKRNIGILVGILTTGYGFVSGHIQTGLSALWQLFSR